MWFKTDSWFYLVQQDANSHGLPHRSCVIIIVLIVQDVGAASANTACKLHFPSMWKEMTGSCGRK